MAAEPGDATDEMLMVRYQRGNAPAFAELVHRHSRPVYNFVLRKLLDPVAAETVTEEVFLRVVRNAAEFKHEARFSTWLYAIARNLCLDRRQPRAPEPPSAKRSRSSTDWRDRSAAAPASTPTGPTAGHAERHVLESILEAVDSLPDDQREVFLMREVANLPFRDIAEITGEPESAVKRRMRYALDRLRDALCHFEEYTRALR